MKGQVIQKYMCEDSETRGLSSRKLAQGWLLLVGSIAFKNPVLPVSLSVCCLVKVLF